MRRKRALLVLGAALGGLFPVAGLADTVRTACLTSERGQSQARLCTCLQRAANQTLSKRDQRRVSTFFKDPEEAERTRRSNARRDEAFWERYEAFGETARKSCKG